MTSMFFVYIRCGNTQGKNIYLNDSLSNFYRIFSSQKQALSIWVDGCFNSLKPKGMLVEDIFLREKEFLVLKTK